MDRFKTALGHIWDQAGAGGATGAERITAFLSIIGQTLWTKVQELAPKAIEALVGVGQKIADFIVSNPAAVFKIAAIAGALIVAIMMLPTLVTGALLTTAGALVYGFVNKLITFTAENAPKWWASFTSWLDGKASAAAHVMDAIGSAIGGWFSGMWSRYIANPVSGAWNSFISSARALPGRTVGAIASLGGLLAAKASSAWTSFKTASVTKAMALVAWMAGLPGRLARAVGDLGKLLVNKGIAVVQGLWSGIQSMGSWIKNKLISWAKSMIPGPIAKALGINSPSKVTTAQGRWIARGLIEGMTGSSKQVKSASAKLADIIADSLKRGSKRTAALRTVSTGTKQLLALAAQEEIVAAKLKTAQKKLADQVAARDKLKADVRNGILNSAGITGRSGSQSPEGILARLQRDRKAAEAFAKHLAALRKKGVRADLIAQIAQAGVEQGSAVAASLASATPAQIKAINKEQGALVSAAGKAGSAAGEAMYGAGIRAGQGIVAGLKKQQKSIEQQMLKIAQAMSKAIRKALGIKSPSRVMARVGAYTAEGLRQGIESGRKAVNRSWPASWTPRPRLSWPRPGRPPGLTAGW
ncbi:phage tail protein [Streptomyces sp. 900105245]